MKKKEESHERYISRVKWRHTFIDGEGLKSEKPLHDTNRQTWRELPKKGKDLQKRKRVEDF